jgi:DUF4097 and DUF4098 domain-containing protein YvlB
MYKIAKNTVVAMAFLIAVGTAWAAQPVSESIPIGPGAEIDIDVLSGTVTILAGSAGVVEVTGTLGDGVESLEIDNDEDGVSIEVEYDEYYHGEQKVDTDLTFRVPAGSNMSVETVSASISADGVTGELDLETVSGNVTVTTMPAALDVETVSGNISIASAPADSDVSSVSGKIEIQAAGGSIDVENVSGTTVIESGVIDDGDLESVSGDITCHAVPGAGGSLDIETMSGVITLVIDSTMVASFDLSTFSGSIQNEIGPEPHRTSKYTPGKELYFNTGTGGPSISLESFSGSIKLITR